MKTKPSALIGGSSSAKAGANANAASLSSIKKKQEIVIVIDSDSDEEDVDFPSADMNQSNGSGTTNGTTNANHVQKNNNINSSSDSNKDVKQSKMSPNPTLRNNNDRNKSASTSKSKSNRKSASSTASSSHLSSTSSSKQKNAHESTNQNRMGKNLKEVSTSTAAKGSIGTEKATSIAHKTTSTNVNSNKIRPRKNSISSIQSNHSIRSSSTNSKRSKKEKKQKRKKEKKKRSKKKQRKESEIINLCDSDSDEGEGEGEGEGLDQSQISKQDPNMKQHEKEDVKVKQPDMSINVSSATTAATSIDVASTTVSSTITAANEESKERKEENQTDGNLSMSVSGAGAATSAVATAAITSAKISTIAAIDQETKENREENKTGEDLSISVPTGAGIAGASADTSSTNDTRTKETKDNKEENETDGEIGPNWLNDDNDEDENDIVRVEEKNENFGKITEHQHQNEVDEDGGKKNERNGEATFHENDLFYDAKMGHGDSDLDNKNDNCGNEYQNPNADNRKQNTPSIGDGGVANRNNQGNRIKNCHSLQNTNVEQNGGKIQKVSNTATVKATPACRTSIKTKTMGIAKTIASVIQSKVGENSMGGHSRPNASKQRSTENEKKHYSNRKSNDNDNNDGAEKPSINYMIPRKRKFESRDKDGSEDIRANKKDTTNDGNDETEKVIINNIIPRKKKVHAANRNATKDTKSITMETENGENSKNQLRRQSTWLSRLQHTENRERDVKKTNTKVQLNIVKKKNSKLSHLNPSDEKKSRIRKQSRLSFIKQQEQREQSLQKLQKPKDKIDLRIEDTASLRKQLKGKKYDINPNKDYCWSCDVQLQNPYEVKKKRIKKGAVNMEGKEAHLTNTSLDYPSFENVCVLHEHPLLKVSSCGPCVDKAYAVEDDVRTLQLLKEDRRKCETVILKDDDEDSNDSHYFNSENLEMEACSWCGSDSQQMLFLCDRCPRAFCERCLINAYGGGLSASNAVKKLQCSDEDWSCINCEPTLIVLKMQRWLSNRPHQPACIVLEDEFSDDDDDDDNGVNPSSNDESIINQLLEHLTNAENLKDKAENMLEEASKKKQLEEIEKEVKSRNFSKEITEELLCHEFNEWRSKWQDQHDKSSDTIGILQDMLEQRGVDLNRFYEERLSTIGKDYSISKEVEAEVLAKFKEQDEERGFEMIGATGWKVSDSREIKDLNPEERDEIEEINTDEGVIERLKIIAKKKDQMEVVDDFYTKALPEDNELLDNLNVRIREKFTEEHDVDIEHNMGKDDVTGSGKSSMERSSCVVVRRGTNRLDNKIQRKHRKRKLPTGDNSLTSVNRQRPQKDTSTERRCNVSNSLLNGEKQTSLLQNQDTYACFHNDICVLATLPSDNQPSSKKNNNIIAVAQPLAAVLKDHQKKGIKFMWDNICSGIIPGTTNEDSSEVKGCVLAHNMGLGKSLQVISLVHTLLTHPLLELKGPRPRIIEHVLLLVPVNTLANWEAEFGKWKRNGIPLLNLHNYNQVKDQNGRLYLLENWFKYGGVLYCSFDTFARTVKSSNDTIKKCFQSPGPDLVVLDEAHLMLKNNKSEISKALSNMRTSRRIALTGTPLQNNLIEYFTMTTWIRPGCLADSEAEFERIYVRPIMKSLVTDTSKEEQLKGEKLLHEVYNKLKPHVQRFDSSVLAKDLKFLQQTVIHVRQTKIQLKLYRAYEKYAKARGTTNFLERYIKMFPVNNHPGCLLVRMLNQKPSAENGTEFHKKGLNIKVEDTNKPIIHNHKNENVNSSDNVIILLDSDDEDEDENYHNNDDKVKLPSQIKELSLDEIWWGKVFKKHGEEMSHLENGGKIILLLQILAHADTIGDKVVIFSQCLKTLDFIERALQLPDWSKHIPSIANLSPGKHWGKWRKNVDYLRIDGSIGAKERGFLVSQFNEKQDSMSSVSQQEISTKNVEDIAKVFLISSKAGNVGINLVGANRVILFDSSWNPSMDEQALHRCYRYGQEKPVYAYRFLTQGTMEEKVYSRSVNKTNLAARVIDNKDPQRNFTSAELDNILAFDNWAQCDLCGKWRMLPPHVEVEDLPDKWFCHMNVHDKPRSSCNAVERDAKFYEKLFYNDQSKKDPNVEPTQSTMEEEEEWINESQPVEEVVIDDKEKNEKTKRDVILERLLMTNLSTSLSEKSKKKNKKDKTNSNALISKYYFHESLLKESGEIKL